MSELSEEELQEIVNNLEKILEVFPHDTAVLHTLIEAYRRQNLEEKYTECLLQLAETATATQSPDDASLTLSLLEKTAVFIPNHDEVVARLKRVSEAKEDGAASLGGSGSEAGYTRTISGELALAWKLMKADEIDQTEYASIVQDLTDNASKQLDVPVSVLHVLQDRGMKNLEKIIAAIIVDSGVPLISLSSFELEMETIMMTPKRFLTQRGAIVFDKMGDHALVALLNPYDRVLQSEIERELKRPCHFYLTSAQEYDKALEVILPQVQAAEQAAADEASAAKAEAAADAEETPPEAPPA